MKTTSSRSWITALLAAFVLSVHETSSATAIGEILPLGDSITTGVGGTGGGYRSPLNLFLNGSGDLFNFVGSATNNATPELILAGQEHHEGHGGYRIDQIHMGLVTSLPPDPSDNGGYWLEGGHGTGRAAIFPDLILLHIGTNDAWQGKTAVEMEILLESLLTEIKNQRPNAQVIVASLVPRTDDIIFEAVQQEYNGAIPGIVAGIGPNFYFLDMHAVLNEFDLEDGIHPNQIGYDKMANAWKNAIQPVAAVEPLSLVTAVSRRPHGTSGNFDIYLPLTGAPGIECRSTGAEGTDTLVFTFNNNVTGGTATVTSGTGVTGAPTFSDNVMSVDLTGVSDAQQITVTLSGVTDAYAQVLPDTAVTMNVLLGDTTANNRVNASDISQTKSQSGITVSEANFRLDVTADGLINSSDVALAKSLSGNAVP